MKKKPMLLKLISQESQQEKSKEKKGYRENSNKMISNKIIGTVVIAVAGMSRGVGCTHTAISIAQYISSENYSVAIVEMNNHSSFSQIYDESYDIGKLEHSFNINGVDYYTNNAHELMKILNAGYDYIVLDLSLVKKLNEKGLVEIDKNMQEMQRANKQILVVGIKEWQMKDIKVAIGDEYSKNYNLYVTFADKNMFSEFENEIDMNTYLAPFCPDPFEFYKDESLIIYEMIKDLFPENHKIKKRGFFK